ncbi:cytochrome P450 [Amycolatopsis sp.]|uniref:cytochrome P450 family protein n=1 Tax=Amycolatopsis sp. TaxID=37632 RepID=UPI002D7E5C9E|nr:cytochrome P450 [Amycolatopsis sp.]HET6711250.1 cytochrome P450 [Amycolatopsis sp.]
MDELILDVAAVRDPHELEAMMRTEAPVRPVRIPRGPRLWLVTRYDDVRSVLTDPRVRKDSAGTTELMTGQLGPHSGALSPAFRALDAHMLNSDPPDHTRLRRLVGRAFTSGTIARLRPRVAEVADGLLDTMAAAETADLIPAFAEPLPMTVICELLGVPEEDRDTFRECVLAITSQDAGGRLATLSARFLEYLRELIERKRAEPGDDLLSDLVTVSDGGDQLAAGELVGMASLLVIAGQDTTVNLIGNGTLSLLRQPDQLAALRSDPDLLPGALEELLRYDGPVHVGTYRYTVEPIVLSGVEIPAGEFVAVSLSSANRDENRFDAPDRLDITRRAAGHVAFGHGIHHCLGAPLARLEGKIALGKLITRFPDLRLDTGTDEPAWRFSLLMRGLEALPVRLR